MKISLSWLKELVDYNLTTDELASKLSLNTIGVKQQTEDYIELDLTYNRGDLLSLRGVAYEVSALTNSSLKFLASTTEDFIWVDKNLPKVSVRVENENLSPIYCVAKIENLKVEQSNDTWVKKLSNSGIRSINNVADVTNLIMVEYGQPMHSFDCAKVTEETLVVRTAKNEEKLTTLDGKTRNLDKSDLLIADPSKALGLAGVMGGKDSEISDSTTSILLEAAIFDPVANRGTSKRHGLYSEATRRFQHGLSPVRTLQALDAAIRMYESLGGKLTAITLLGNFEQPKKTISLNLENVNKLLGIKLDEETVISCLKRLNFTLETKSLGVLEVTVPYFRLDINIEEDLIEEVARMYGYEKIEGIPLSNEKIPTLDQTLPEFIYNLKLKLKELGLTEVQTYSFYSTAALEALQIGTEAKKDLIKIANPISSETEYLRSDIWPNLLEVIGKNIKKGYKDIAIFEIGKIHFRNEQQKPDEKYTLSIALMNDSDNPLQELSVILNTFASLSVNSVKNIIDTLRLESPVDFLVTQGDITINPAKEPSTLFHPNRIIDGAGEVHLRLLNKLGIEKRVAVLEFDISL